MESSDELAAIAAEIHSLYCQMEELRKRVSELNIMYNAKASPLMARSIYDVGLSRRTMNVMRRLGIETIGDLLKLSYSELFEAKGLGITSMREVREKLESIGLKWC